MKFSVLASSSKGNSTWLESGDTAILIDAGSSCLALSQKIKSINRDPGNVSAICITHDHIDHVSALETIERKRPVPIYATGGTIEAVCASRSGAENWPWMDIASGERFEIGPFSILPFSVPHDAADPIGFVFSADDTKFGYATDMGEPTLPIRAALMDCDALALEFNHEKHMLMESNRPWSLKQRIAGRSGHLSNAQACELLVQIATRRLKILMPMHLSDECNSRDAALASARAALLEKGLPVSTLVRPACPTPLLEIAPGAEAPAR